MTAENRIPYEVSKALGYDVYALRDPRSRQVCYITKGIGERVFSHQKDADDSAATQSEAQPRLRDPPRRRTSRASRNEIRAINIDGSQNPCRKVLTGFNGASLEGEERSHG